MHAAPEQPSSQRRTLCMARVTVTTRISGSAAVCSGMRTVLLFHSGGRCGLLL
jgi:hypothetical protein